jgi:hypothetical protein
MSDEPESLILQMLRQMRADMGDMRTEIGEVRSSLSTKIDGLGAELRSEMRSLGADVASDMIVNRKEVGDQIVGLRRAVMEYHTSVIGHGIIISELEARVRRVEQHLNLPTLDQH